MADKKFNPLPGFGLTMGYTLLYLSVLVLVPLAGLFLKAFQISWGDFWRLIIDALVDFPFALPTAVAGLTLCSLFSENGWLGRFLVPLGIKATYTPLAVV